MHSSKIRRLTLYRRAIPDLLVGTSGSLPPVVLISIALCTCLVTALAALVPVESRVLNHTENRVLPNK